MGFTEVFDYAPGKLDWLARGMASEGTKADEPRAGTVAKREVPTCGLDDRVADVRKKVGDGDVCVVINDARVVAGVLGPEELDGNDDQRAEDVMRPGPSTFRPHVPIDEMAKYMQKHDLASAPITSADGTLIGVLFRQDALAAARGKDRG